MRVKFEPWIIFVFGLITGLILSQSLSPKAIFASTTHEMTGSNSVQQYDPSLGSGGATSTNRYVFRYRVPVGTSFDRIQMRIPETQGVYTKTLFSYLYTDVGDPFESCTDSTCLVGDIENKVLTNISNSKVADTALQFLYSTSTLIQNSDQYFVLILDPNAPFSGPVTYYQTLNGIGYSENGSNLNRVPAAPTLKFCSGVCDDNNFTVIDGNQPTPQNFDIAILAPEYGTTTGTTTVNLKSFFLYDTPVSTTTRAEILVYDYLTDELEYTYQQTVPAGFDVSFILDTNTELATGSKKMLARYVIASNNFELIPTEESFFSVLVNTYQQATGLESPINGANDLSQIDCSTFDVGCQFQKAITFLFVPSQNVLDKFVSLWQRLKTVVPFGYFFVAIDYLNGIDSLAIGAYSFPDLPFQTAIFDPINNALGFLLWGVFAFAFYNNRVKNIDL